MDDEDFDDLIVSFNKYGNWSPVFWNEQNISDCGTTNTQWRIKSAGEIAIKASATLAIAIGGLYLNSVIMLVLLKNKSLWSPTNCLIGNLALVDFVILLTCPWFMLFRDFYEGYILGYYGCKVDGFLQASLLLANVGAVILVSYDRLAAAALAVEARVTKSGAPKLIIISWLVALSMAIPLIFSTNYVERQCLDQVQSFCLEDVKILSIYWHFVLLLLVWIPLGVMLITYGGIIWRLGKTSKELRSRGGGQAVSKAKSKALRVTACVLLVDIICRLPYSLLVYLRSNTDLNIHAVEGPLDEIWFTAQFLMYANCAINPLIYGFTNTRFRKAMDKTPGVACCKFGSWCCVCFPFQKKKMQTQEMDSVKIFVIEISPKPSIKLKKIIKKVLHINKDAIDLNIHKENELNSKSTKATHVSIERM